MANEFKIKKGLIVTGASGGTVVDIQGSQGQLFSVTDDLSGSIFAVSDISGVPILDVNSSGISYFDGKLGIGTANPSRQLEVVSSSGIVTVLTSTTGGSYISMEDSATTSDSQVRFGAIGDNAIIKSGGTTALTLSSSQNATFAGDVTVSGGDLTINSTGNAVLNVNGTANSFIEKDTGTDLYIANNVSDKDIRFRVKDDGTNLIALTIDGSEGGDATFAAQAFATTATSSSDASSTLTTKGYVDGLITGATIYRGAWQAGISATSSAATTASTTLTVTAAILDADGNTPVLVGAVVTGEGITGIVKVASVTSSTVYVLDTAIDATATAYIFSPIHGAPSLDGVTQTSGYYYICSEAGSATPNGANSEPNTWNVGDWCIYNDVSGTGQWQKIDNSSVLSGAGTGQTVALWEGPSSVTDSDTLGNAPITVSGSDTTFAGSITAEFATSSAMLNLYNTTNGGGSTIRFSDQTTQTQVGDITFYHTDGASQGGGASWHFTSQPDTVLVVGSSTVNGRFVAKSASSATEVDYGFYDDVNTGMYRAGADTLAFSTAGTEKMRIGSNGAIKFNSYGLGNLGGSGGFLLGVNTTGDIYEANAADLPGGPYLPLAAGSGSSLTDNLYINDVDQNNVNRYGNLRSEVGFSRSPVTGNPNQWFKVVELGGSPKRIKFSIIATGDNTNSYDNFLISTSGYGMNMHIEKLPGGRYNTSKLLSVAVINPSNSGGVEIWIKLGPVSSGTGATLVACTSDVLASATILASATTTAPTLTSNDTQLDISGDNRNHATIQTSRGATFGAKVGIGTNAPAAMLTVAGGDATITGNVGIGTTSTSYALDVEAGGTGDVLGDSTTAAIFRAGRQNVWFQNQRTAAGTDWNNNTFKIIAKIDTTSHQSINFVNDASYNEHIDIYTGNQVFNTRFNANGDVGIGQTTPLNSLDVYRATGDASIRIQAETATASTILRFRNSNADADITVDYTTSNQARMVFTTDNSGGYVPVLSLEANRDTLMYGNVGIGVTSPTAKLHVDGDLIITDTPQGQGDFLTVNPISGKVTTVSSQDVSFGEAYISNYRSRVLDYGGTYFPTGAAGNVAKHKTNNLFNLMSMMLLPGGVFSGKITAAKPKTGVDFTWTRTTVANYTNEEGVITEAPIATPRIDYANNSNGEILIEPTRTNIVPNSGPGDYGNGPGSELTVPGPNGIYNSAIVPVPNNGSDRYQYTIPSGTYNDGDVFTYSWYRRRLSTPITTAYLGDLQLNVLVNCTQTGDTVQIESNISGFDRFSAEVTLTLGNTNALVRAYFGNVVGTGNSSVAYFGHQLELGDFATTLINTTGSAVTRDNDYMIVNNLSDTIFQGMVGQGGMYMDFDYKREGGADGLRFYDENNITPRVYLYQGVTGLSDSWNAGAFTLNQTSGNKIGYMFTSTTSAVYCANGSNVATSSPTAAQALDTPLDTLYIDGNQNLIRIRELSMFTQMTSAQLVTLTSL